MMHLQTKKFHRFFIDKKLLLAGFLTLLVLSVPVFVIYQNKQTNLSASAFSLAEIEAEAGGTNAQIAVGNDENASGGKYIQFGGIQPTSIPSTAPSLTQTPSTSGEKLSWAPPVGYENYTKVTVPTTGGTLNLTNGTDYQILAPNAITGPVTLVGGRNIVWIGGTFGGRTNVPSGSYDSPNRGIRISDGSDVRIVFLEGLWFKPGTYLSDAIQFAIRTNNGTTAIVQNVRVDAINYGTQATVHADVIQAWGGPRTLLIDGLTAKHATYQGFYLDPADGRSVPSGSGEPWVTRRVNLEGDDRLGGAKYLLADREPSLTKMTSDRVYTIGAKFNSTDSFGSWPSAGLFQGATPPGGDFVPASLWNGTSYLSPGYIN
ncbi:MAG: hypothetical protein AAB553_06270 [Patescibacteria group bacterium]